MLLLIVSSFRYRQRGTSLSLLFGVNPKLRIAKCGLEKQGTLLFCVVEGIFWY